MIAVAYTDGSYKEFSDVGGVYSGACLVVADNVESKALLSKADNNVEFLSLRNVAGEISAVMMACEYCMNTLNMKQGDILLIKHDYVGLDYWTRPKHDKSYWKAKNKLSITYRDYMNTKVKTRFTVQFEHVKGHSGNAANEAVDSAAASAIDEYVTSLRRLTRGEEEI